MGDCIKCDKYYHHWYDFKEHHWMWCESCGATMYQNTRLKTAPTIKDGGHNPIALANWEEFYDFLGQDNVSILMGQNFKLEYHGQGQDRPLYSMTILFNKEFEGCSSWLAKIIFYEGSPLKFHIYGAPL